MITIFKNKNDIPGDMDYIELNDVFFNQNTASRLDSMASAIIEKIDDSFAELYSSVNTGNLVVDSIIGRFKERLEQIGCAVELSVKINKNRKIMDDYDLVVVLGNVTDNIIEAVTCGEKKRSYVEMKLEMTHTSFVFYAKNSVSSEKKKEKNKWFHGLGLSNVKDTVENYGGTMLVSHTKESYETMIQVPIREE